MEKEIWETIPGYSLYQASNMGRLKTFNWKNQGTERIMRPALDTRGYLRTMLKRDSDGEIHTIKVHRIILLTFMGEPLYKDYECNHKNGIPSDNRLSNLEWVSRSYNQIHSFKVLGRERKFGSKNSMATLTEEQVIEIRKNYVYGRKSRHEGGMTKPQIAKKYGVGLAAIKQIILGQSWRHLL